MNRSIYIQQAIRTMMIFRNMSTIQLAELSGINKNSIYVLLEKTDINPTINTLERISNALEISVQRLLDLPKKIEEFIDDASN